MSDKKRLKGFSKFSLFPITKNNDDEYAVGSKVAIPYAQTLTKAPNTNENEIYADDDVYENETEHKGYNFTITLAELPDVLRPYLEGGTYDDNTKEYSFGTNDVAPEFACTYRGLMSNGNYKMFRQYRAVVSSIVTDLNTKGNGTNASVQISGKFLPRACDKKVDVTKEAESSSDLTWLDTIPAVTPGY